MPTNWSLTSDKQGLWSLESFQYLWHTSLPGCGCSSLHEETQLAPPASGRALTSHVRTAQSQPPGEGELVAGGTARDSYAQEHEHFGQLNLQEMQLLAESSG